MDTAARHVSLLKLDDTSLLGIIEYLQLEDRVNLAQSCKRLMRITKYSFRQHSEFLLDSTTLGKGESYVNSVLLCIGRLVRTLIIDFTSATVCKLPRILNKCENLNSLRIHSLEVTPEDPFVRHADKLRTVALGDCDLCKLKRFMELFSNLTSLVIWESESFKHEQMQIDVLEMILRNNPNIINLAFYERFGQNFPFRLLRYIPDINRLAANYMHEELENVTFDSLADFKLLTCLRLNCFDWLIDDLLTGLAKIGILEQMELNNGVRLEDSSYEILKKFKKLKLLAIAIGGTSAMPKSTVWPPNLQHVSLSHYFISVDDLVSTIKQLPNLKSFDVQYSHIACDVSDFQFSKGWIDRIENIFDRSGRTHLLDMVLPQKLRFTCFDSAKCVYQSQRLRIWPWSLNSNQLKINISFPEWLFDPNGDEAQFLHQKEIKLI